MLRVVPIQGPAMRLSLAGPSGVDLGLRALQWLACLDPVTGASGFPYRSYFDGGLCRCTGAVSCGRRHLPFRVGGRHARVPCVCACARPSWPGRASRPPGRVLVRLPFSSGRSVFLPCLAPFGLRLPLSWSFVCPPLVSPPPPPFFFSFRKLFFFFGRAPPLSLAFFGVRPRVPWALAFVFLSSPPPRPVVFFLCVRPLCLWLSLVSDPGCPGPWRCVLLGLLASRFSALRALSPRLCFPAGRWLLPVGCCPPSPLSCLKVFVAASRCSVFFFLVRCVPPLSLAFTGLRPRVPWALALWVVCFVGLPLLCSPCALASFVCPTSPVAALWWLLPPPSLSVAHFSSLGAPFFVFFRSFVPRPRCLCPRCLWLSLVSSPGCPGRWRCGLFVLLASRFSALGALSPRLCVPPRRWLLSGGCCPPLPFCRAVFVARCPVLCFLSLFRSAPPLSLPPLSLAFSGFPPGALGLGTVCCLLWWPPASRLALRSRLFCVSCLAVGSILVVAAPPPPFVSRGFRRCHSVLGFFFVCPRCLWLSLVPGPGCPGPLRCVLFVLLASRFLARCALSPLFCFPPGPGLLPGVCCPPSPPFCVSRFSSLPLGARLFFFVVRPGRLRHFLVFSPGCLGPWRCVLFVLRTAGCGVPCFASCGVVSCGAAVCGVFCAVPGVVWRACVWLGSCAVLWWVLLCCFCCALLSCVAAFSAGFFFVVPCLSVVLRAVSVSVLCLCGAVPVCLRRCSLCVALLPLRRWLVFCVVVYCVCVFAVGPGCPLLSPVGSWWVLVSCFGGVLWCVPGCCAAPLCCVLCRLALRCCALCCFVLLCLVLSHAVSCLGALSVVLWSCVFGAVFCLVSSRCVCFAVVCCRLVLCFVPCASWGVVLCVPALSALCGVAVLHCSPLVPCSPVLCPVVLCCRVVVWCHVLLPCLFGFSYLSNRCKIGF